MKIANQQERLIKTSTDTYQTQTLPSEFQKSAQFLNNFSRDIPSTSAASGYQSNKRKGQVTNSVDSTSPF